MSTTIDQNVVQMQFDNADFEKNVNKSMGTIEKLKKSLHFDEGESFSGITKAASKVTLAPMITAADEAGKSFNAMSVAAVTALATITNQAVLTGERMAKALSIDQISAGFGEYELKMGSVQTIMSGTGESLQTVMDSLEELNRYADKTIYIFSDMTSNIGKFTNAGVDLQTAVAAMKGISNEAALAGASAGEASRAMYNIAQAMGTGYMQLIDWKSIENANMATMDFKRTLVETGKELGTITDGMDVSADNFRETLQKKWLTNDVLLTALSKYSDETTALGKKAYAAAQDIKTFTQLFDTMKESVQSGWAETWENIIGNFDEAKELFTSISKVFDTLAGASADARNSLLKDWKALGGRKALIDALWNSFYNIHKIINAIRLGFRDVFPKTTAEQLTNFSKGLRDFTKAIGLSYDGLDGLRNIVRTLVTPLSWVVTILKKVGTVGLNLVIIIKNVVDSLLSLAGTQKSLIGLNGQVEKFGKLKAILYAFNRIAKATATIIGNLFSGITGVKGADGAFAVLNGFLNLIVAISEGAGTGVVFIFESIASALEAIASLTLNFNGLNGFIESLTGFNPNLKLPNFLSLVKGGLTGIISVVFLAVSGIKSLFNTINGAKNSVISNLFPGLSGTKDDIEDTDVAFGSLTTTIEDGEVPLSGITKTTETFSEKIKELTGNLNPAKIATVAFGVGITVLSLKLLKALSAVDEALEGFNFMTRAAKNMFNSIAGAFKSSAFLKFAEGIAIIAASIAMLAYVDKNGDLVKATACLTTLSVILLTSAIVMGKAAKSFDEAGIGKLAKLAVAMTSFAVTIGGMALVMKYISGMNISKNDVKNVAILTGIVTVLGILAMNISEIGNKNDNTHILQGITMMAAMAGSMFIIVKAMQQIATIDTDKLIPSIYGMVGLITAMSLFALTAGRIKAFSGTRLIGLAVSIFLVSAAIAKLADMTTVFDTLTELGHRIEENYVSIASIGLILIVFAGAIYLAGANMGKIAAALIALSVSMVIVSKAAQTLMNSQKSFIDFFNEAGGALALIGTMLTAMTVIIGKNFKEVANVSSTILALVAGIMAIIGAVAILKYMANTDEEGLKKGIHYVGMITLLFDAMLLCSKNANAGIKSGLVIIGALGVMTAMVSAFAILAKDQATLDKGYEVTRNLVLLLGGLIVVIDILQIIKNKFGNSKKTIANVTTSMDELVKKVGKWGTLATVVASAVATMLALKEVFVAVKDISADQMLGTAMAMGVAVAAISTCLGILAKSMKNDRGDMVTAAACISAGVAAMYILGEAMKNIGSTLEGTEITKTGWAIAIALDSIAVALIALIKFTKGSTTKDLLAAAVSLDVACVAILGIAKALSMLKGMDNLIGGIGSMVVVLGTLVIATERLAALSTNAIIGAGSVIALSGALIVLSYGLQKLNEITHPVQVILDLAFAIGILGGATYVLGKFSAEAIVGTGIVLALSAALLMLGNGLAVIGNMQHPILVLVDLAGALLILSGAAMALTKSVALVVPGLIVMVGMAGVLALFGKALQITAGGVELLATSFDHLTMYSIGQIASDLTKFAGSLAALALASIPMAASAPFILIYAAALGVLAGTLSKIAKVFDSVDVAGSLSDVGSAFLDHLIGGIQHGLDLGRMTTIAQFTVAGFTNGIESNLDGVGRSGNLIADALVNGVKTSLDINSPSRVMESLGGFTNSGFVSGIQNSIDSIRNAGILIANTISETVRNELGIHSPSTEGEEVGKHYDEGIVKGILGGLSSLVISRLGGIPATLSSIFDSASSLSKFFDSGSNNTDSYISGLLSGESGVVGAAKEFVKDAYNTLTSDGSLSSIWNAGASAAKAYHDGLLGVYEKQTDDRKYSGMPTELRNSLKESESLAKIQNDLGKYYTADSIQTAIENNKSLIQDIYSSSLSINDIVTRLDEDSILSNTLVKIGDEENNTTNSTTDLTEASEELATSLDSTGSSASSAASTVKTLADTINEALDAFKAFNNEVTSTPETLLKNMSSQIVGVATWGKTLSELYTKFAKEGLGTELLDSLKEQGPEKSYDTIMALSKANKKERKKLVKMYKEIAQIGDKTETELTKVVTDNSKKKVKDTKDKVTKTEKSQKNYFDKLISKYSKAEKEISDKCSTITTAMQSLLDDSSSMFKKWEDSEETSTKNITSNMASQLKGIIDWSNGIEKLQGLGLNSDLINKMKSMGTASSSMVKALTQSTEEELSTVNKLNEIMEGLADTEADGFEERLKAAEEYLNGLELLNEEEVSAIDQLKEDLKDGLSDLGDVFGKVELNDVTSLDDLKKNLNSRLSLTKEYYTGIGKLSKLGYSNDVIDWVQKQGVDTAHTFMSSLINASSEEIEYVNAIFSDMTNVQEYITNGENGIYEAFIDSTDKIKESWKDTIKELQEEFKNASFTSEFNFDTNVNSNIISKNFASQSLAKVEFAKYINQLYEQASNDIVSLNFVEQIKNMGYESGYAYAKAFATMSDAELKSFSSTWKIMENLSEDASDNMIDEAISAMSTIVNSYKHSIKELQEEFKNTSFTTEFNFETKVSADTIAKNFVSQAMAKIRFAEYINNLYEKASQNIISLNLVEQIKNMGYESGYAYAKAFANMTDAELQSLSSAWKSMENLSEDASDSMIADAISAMSTIEDSYKKSVKELRQYIEDTVRNTGNLFTKITKNEFSFGDLFKIGQSNFNDLEDFKNGLTSIKSVISDDLYETFANGGVSEYGTLIKQLAKDPTMAEALNAYNEYIRALEGSMNLNYDESTRRALEQVANMLYDKWGDSWAHYQKTGEEADKLSERYDNLKSSIESVTKSVSFMVKEFDKGTKVTKYQLMKNVQSNVDGLNEWKEGLASLHEKGLSDFIYDMLISEGPSSSNIVKLINSFTTEEIAALNSAGENIENAAGGIAVALKYMLTGEIDTSDEDNYQAFLKITDKLSEAGYQFFDQAAMDGERIKDVYQSIAESIADSIGTISGLFTKFERDSGTSTSQMLKNLKSQVLGNLDWQKEMQVLEDRIGADLFESIAKMSPSEGYQIAHLLNTLYDDESTRELVKQIEEALNDAGEDVTFDSIRDAFTRLDTSLLNTAINTTSLSDAVKTMGESLKSSLHSVTGLFTKFEEKSSTATSEMLENLKSQIEGTSKWEKEMTNLGKRVGTDLYAAIAEMSPSEGYILAKLINSLPDNVVEMIDTVFANTGDEMTYSNVIAVLKNLNPALLDDVIATNKLEEAMTSMADSVRDTTSNLSNLFSEFTDDSSISTSTMLKNFSSQIKGMRKWYSSMSNLSKRVSSKLWNQLASMGYKESYQYVKVFESLPQSILDMIDTAFSTGDMEDLSMTGLLNILSKVDTSLLDSVSDLTKITDTFENLSDTIEGQIKIFEQFDDTVDVTSADIIENMKSQIEGVTEWSENIAKLSGRGISNELLNYLAAMGPEGYKYAAALVDMTDSELQEVNKLYTKSLSLPESASNTVINSYKQIGGSASSSFASGYNSNEVIKKIVESITAATEEATEASESLGMQVVSVLSEAITNANMGEDSATSAMSKVIESILDSIKDTLGIDDAKTSLTMKEIGTSIVVSMSNGMNENLPYFDSILKQIYGSLSNVRNLIMIGLNNVNKTLNQFYKDAGAAMYNHMRSGLSNIDSWLASISALVSSRRGNFILTGYSIGTAITDGISNGLSSGCSSVVATAVSVASAAVSAMKSELGIHSPSKAFAEIGMYAMMGLSNGILDYGNDVVVATEDVSNDSIETMRKTLNAIGKLIDGELDGDPVIRPVMDLSNIQNGVDLMSSMISGTSLDVSTGTLRAQGIAADMTRKVEASNTTATAPTTSNITFTQNNYSPKSLSRIDIYRSTRNQLSAMKEVLGGV